MTPPLSKTSPSLVETEARPANLEGLEWTAGTILQAATQYQAAVRLANQHNALLASLSARPVTTEAEKESGITDTPEDRVEHVRQKTLSESSLQELRVRVAELCGYKHHDLRFEQCSHGGIYACRVCDKSYCSPPWGLEKLKREWCDTQSHGASVPDYCNDLNACAEFEKSIHDIGAVTGRWNIYARTLDRICAHSGDDPRHATAEQRCRAFVKTMEGAPSVSSGVGAEPDLGGKDA